MMQVRKEGSKYYVEINFSSLDLIQTCMRKSFYVLHEKFRSDSESTALTFGSGIHKALEVWYKLPISARNLSSDFREYAQLIGYGTFNGQGEPALLAIRAFYDSTAQHLAQLDETDKRSIQSGIKILSAYFKHYQNDGLEVYADKDGPCIEREVSFEIYDSPELNIKYFGTIDIILRNSQTGLVMVADHKTTHALGSEFYQRCKPNFQYCGYVLAARKVLNVDTNLFMVNGIQVAKTKQEFARQVVEYSEENFAELKDAVVMRVKSYVSALETGSWPMTSPGPCSNYGGCQFLDVCSVPEKIKKSVIEAKFGRTI